MRTRTLSSILFALVAAGAIAQKPTTKEIVAIAKEEMAKQHIPGLAIAVVERGKVHHQKAYGKANLEWNIDATIDSPFKIASVSKQFICTAILKLAEEGKLSVDDPLTKFFPDAPEFWKKIQLRRLMSHTSGLPRELPGWDNLATYTEADWQKMAYEAKPQFEPGAKYQYCNIGYFLLSMIITKVAGKTWNEYMIESIFKPNGMNASRATSDEDIIANRVNGYLWKTDKWVNEEPLLSIRPSGAFISSLRDLVRWEQVLVAKKFLRPEFYKMQFAPTSLNDGLISEYGFGWNTAKDQGEQYYSHGGSLLGFRSVYVRNVDSGITVIVLANSDSANCGAITDRILTLYNRK